MVNKWPEDSAWDFVAVGRGHDIEFWTRFLRALDGSTRTWRSTSNTRTSNSASSKACGRRGNSEGSQFRDGALVTAETGWDASTAQAMRIDPSETT